MLSTTVRAHRDRILHAFGTVLCLQRGRRAVTANETQCFTGNVASFGQESRQVPPSSWTAAVAAPGSCWSQQQANAWSWMLFFRNFKTPSAGYCSDDGARQLTRSIKAADSIPSLLELIKRHGADMNHIHVSAMFTRTRALFGGNSRRLQDPAVQQLLQQMEQLAVQVQQQCTAREIANIIWSCGYLSLPGVLVLLLPRLLQPHVLQQAKAQHLSNTLLGVAKSDAARAPDQLQQLLTAFSQQLADATPQSISNTLWAVATMGEQVPANHLQQLLSAFSNKSADAKPQEISNTLGAVATMGLQITAEQLQQLLSAFCRQLAYAKPQEISNLLWAVATMGRQVPASQLQQLLSAFTRQLADAKPQAISNTLWAVATMGHQLSEEQLQDFVAPFTIRLDATNIQELANTLWACAEQQYAPLQLLAALEQRQHYLQQQLTTTAPMHISSIAYACGQLGYCSQLLPGALLQAAANRCRQDGAKAFDPQELTNLCWSAAVLDQQQYAPQVLELAAACSAVWHAMQAEELRQLYQVHLWLSDSQVSGGLSGVLTPQQLQQCRREWELQLAATAKASKLQQQVFAAVQQLLAAHSRWCIQH